MAHLIARSETSGEQPFYRVWHAWNVPHNMDYYAVEDPSEAAGLIAKLLRADLANPLITSNAFGLEVLEDGEYHEWYSEQGNPIDPLAKVVLERR